MAIQMRRVATGKRDAVGKALEVLWALLDADGKEEKRSVRNLALRLGVSPATVYRTLTTLQRHGLVQQNAKSGQYQIGMELYRLALQVTSRLSIRDAALPVMQELVSKCNETTFLIMYDSSRREMMFVAAVHSSHPLRYTVPMNEWVPVHAGASGFAIMAFLPDDERRAIVAQTKLRPLTTQTITDPVALGEELARVRGRGYALSRGQRNIGAVSVAAPLWDTRGVIMGALAISMPEARFKSGMERLLAQLVLQAASHIMDRTGGSRPVVQNNSRLAPGRSSTSKKSSVVLRSPIPDNGQSTRKDRKRSRLAV
jgi:DNA-binding IclR family transcriptional regulator